MVEGIDVERATQATSVGLNRYQDDRFGMFVHWGLYSLIGSHEWEMFRERWPITEYEKLASQFEAPLFDATDWARTAADAGQRYITITSRHHDGFSMYRTALSEYNVTRTPFGRDPLAELAEACRHEGVRLGFYVSLLDWHHPAYRAVLREKSGLAWDDYLGFLYGQIEELCTGYGDVATFWLDGYWQLPPGYDDHNAFRSWIERGGDFDFPRMYELLHGLQPDAVIMNNHHHAPMPGEDVQGFEGDVPGENSHLWNTTPPILDARESCQTVMQRSYGWDEHDHQYRSGTELLTMLLRCAGAGSNFLLNVGPTPEGEIPGPAKARLAELGRWLRCNGEGVYGTRLGRPSVMGEFPTDGDRRSSSVVATTRSDTVHYLHLLDESAPTRFTVDLPFGTTATSATACVLHDGAPVTAEVRGEGDSVRITVPAERRTGSATTVRLELG